MDKNHRECPDCADEGLDRRRFLLTAGAAAATVAAAPLFAVPKAVGRADAQQPRRDGRESSLRNAHREAEKGYVFQLGL